jgi:hypothetical protein
MIELRKIVFKDTDPRIKEVTTTRVTVKKADHEEIQFFNETKFKLQVEANGSFYIDPIKNTSKEEE